MEVVCEFEHQDEVIKVRNMPNSCLVASMTNTGLVNLYNIPEIQGEEFSGERLDGQLKGLTIEGFALSWNKKKQGLICSCAEDYLVVWNALQSKEPMQKFLNAHSKDINDVRFGEANNPELMISTAEDGHFKLWDLRQEKATMLYQASEESLCVGAFNPINEHLFAVAGDPSGNV